MIKEGRYIYGERCFETHKVGSMVSWQPLTKDKQYGIISKTFVVQIENDERFVAFANVSSATGGNLDLMLKQLKLESEVKKCPPNPEKKDS